MQSSAIKCYHDFHVISHKDLEMLRWLHLLCLLDSSEYLSLFKSEMNNHE